MNSDRELLQQAADMIREAKSWVEIYDLSECCDYEKETQEKRSFLERVEVLLLRLPKEISPPDTRTKHERIIDYLAPRTYCNKDVQEAIRLVRQAASPAVPKLYRK